MSSDKSDRAAELIPALEAGIIGIDLADGPDWSVKSVWELQEKLPGGGTAMPTQRWEPLQRPDYVFTSEQLDAAIATPENLHASMAKHGHVIFVLCQNEGEERDRLRREGVDTDRIKFVVLLEVPKCDVCGDLANSDRRCHRHGKRPGHDDRPGEHPTARSGRAHRRRSAPVYAAV